MNSTAAPRQNKTAPDVQRKAYSLQEFQAMYGLGRTSVYNLIAEGTLPTVKAGRRRLVTVEGERQFLRNIGAA
jgi:predicted DNA-binding transcriptional regulator AlpA